MRRFSYHFIYFQLPPDTCVVFCAFISYPDLIYARNDVVINILLFEKLTWIFIARLPVFIPRAYAL